MSNMHKDEMAMLKAIAIKLDDKSVLLATFQYHSENNEFGKTDRSKTRYRWMARVDTLDNIRTMMQDWMSDAKRLEKNKWPDDNDWNGPILVNNGSTYAELARFFAIKCQKIVDWETGQKILAGWKKKTAKRPERCDASLAYAVDGYTATNGDIIDLTDKTALLKHVGQTLFRKNTPQPKQTKNTVVA